jgi:hypothetical protein
MSLQSTIFACACDPILTAREEDSIAETVRLDYAVSSEAYKRHIVAAKNLGRKRERGRNGTGSEQVSGQRHHRASKQAVNSPQPATKPQDVADSSRDREPESHDSPAAATPAASK